MLFITFDENTKYLTGVYDDTINKVIPNNAVNITEATFNNIHNNGFNYYKDGEIVKKSNIPDLEETRQLKLNKLDILKNQLIDSVIEYQQNEFQADTQSISEMNIYCLEFLNGIRTKNIKWRTFNNNIIELTQSDLKIILNVYSKRKENILLKYWEIKDNINKAKSIEKLDTININELMD